MQGKSERSTKSTAAKNLPQTISLSVMGLEYINSIVPSLFSSAILFIVTAGTRNKKTQGEMTNSVSSPAYPLSRILYSVGNTHKNRLLIMRKTIMTMYPVILLKKSFNSFFNMATISFYLFPNLEIGGKNSFFIDELAC